MGGLVDAIFGGGGDAPPPPDYRAAAQETAKGNLEAAKYTTAANRINQYTPYGSLTYTRKQPTFDQAGYDKAMQAYQYGLQNKTAAPYKTAAPQTITSYFDRNNLKKNISNTVMSAFSGQDFGGQDYGGNGVLSAPRREDFMFPDDGGGWEQRMELTPQAQATLDKQMALSDKYADVANIGFDKTRAIFENPEIDESTLPQRAINVGQTAQEALLARLNPTLMNDEEALRTRLANQGIGLGSNAYTREMMLQGQRGNDLRLQAALQGINLDQANRAAALNEAYTKQSRPLDLVNALRTGAQVQNPQFQPYAQQQTTTGPNMSQAAQLGYEGQMGLFNAGEARDERKQNMMMQAAGMFLSDRRTKENIVKIGVLDNGLNIYKFDYKPEFKDIAGHGSFVGVMADEAKAIPGAVIRQSNGYDMVDYSKVYA